MQHFNKEHYGLVENILQDDVLEREYHKTLKSVQDMAVIWPSPPSPSKSVARKSTSTSTLQKSTEEFSNYGIEVEKMDFNQIKTSVDLNGKYTELSAQELSEIMDLQPYVEVEDCNLLLDVPDIFMS